MKQYESPEMSMQDIRINAFVATSTDLEPELGEGDNGGDMLWD